MFVTCLHGLCICCWGGFCCCCCCCSFIELWRSRCYRIAWLPVQSWEWIFSLRNSGSIRVPNLGIFIPLFLFLERLRDWLLHFLFHLHPCFYYSELLLRLYHRETARNVLYLERKNLMRDYLFGKTRSILLFAPISLASSLTPFRRLFNWCAEIVTIFRITLFLILPRFWTVLVDFIGMHFWEMPIS